MFAARHAMLTSAKRSVIFGAVGAGQSAPTSTPISWGQVSSGADKALLLALAYRYYTPGGLTFSVQLSNGASLTQLSRQEANYIGFNNRGLAVFGIINPPDGTLTITVSGPMPVNDAKLIGNSSLFNGVSSFGTAATATAASMSATADTNGRIFQAFAGWGAMGGYSQTQRWSATGNGGDTTLGLLIGDAPGNGASSVSFSATGASFGSAIPLVA